MERETAMKILKELHNKSLFAERTALETIIPELKESEDERIRKALVRFHKSTIDIDGIKGADILAWLEKQGESYTKNDVNDAYLKGICDAKHELEKQGEQKPVDKVEPFDKYEGLTDFERTLADICIGWIGEELGWKQYIKDSADVLLKIAIKMFNSIQDAPFEQKPAWSDEDEIEIPFGAKDSELQEDTYYIPKGFHAEIDDDKVVIKKGEKSAAWNVEDSSKVQRICKYLDEAKKYYADITEVRECMDWLKSLKQRIGWKPSEEQIHAFIQVYVWYSNNFTPSAALTSLYNDLKKL